LIVSNLEEWHTRRLEQWGQTPQTRIPDFEAAIKLIERVGIATLFAVSPEIPNLFQAFMGDSKAQGDSEWDSPAGEVYTWRWILGRRDAAFYTAIVLSRPTWVSWELLPAILRLRGELSTPEQLYQDGKLSAGAYKIAQALETSDGILSTRQLRQQAGFPTGKAQRAAYLKAVEELDTRLLVAKVFSQEDEEMRHALVRSRYPEHVAASERMSREEALEQFLKIYLSQAAFASPTVLAKHFKLAEQELRVGLEHLVKTTKQVTSVEFPGYKGIYYAWEF